MLKRGMTETQFNWIFIAIAGAVILLFFFSFVQKQKSTEEQKSDITIEKNLQSILTGAEVSKQTENIISVPDIEISYSCEGFSIGSLDAFNPRIVFSSSLLKSNNRQLIFYSLEWRVPFRTSNFLYVTSPEVRYIIVDDNDLDDDSIANQLYNSLPENMDKEIVLSSETIANKNNYKIKIVFFDAENLNLNSINGEISKIKIIPIKDGLDGYGKIEFDDGIQYYLKKESVIAAVFSEDKEIYECNIKKAMKRMKNVYEVYGKRINEINEKYTEDNHVCKDVYDSSLFDINPDLSNTPNIYKNMESLEDKNQIIAIKSCALMY